MKRRYFVLFVVLLFFGTLLNAQQQEIDSLKTILTGEDLHDTTTALVLKRLAWRYMNLKPDTAMLLASQSYELSKKNDQRLGVKNGLNTIGGILVMTGNFHEAEGYYKKLLKMEETDQVLPRVRVAYNNLGAVYFRKSEYDSAVFYYSKSLDVARSLGNKDGEALVLRNISDVLIDHGKLDEAKGYLTEALAIAEETKSSKLLQDIWESLGKVWMITKEYEESANGFEKSLFYAQQTDDQINIANINNHLGSLFLEQGDADKSLRYHKNALESHRSVDDKLGIVSDEISIVKNLLSRENPLYGQAERYLIEAKTMAEVHGQKLNLSECLLLLSKVRQGLGDYKEALSFQKEYQVLRDSIFSDQQNRVLAEMQTKYETRKIENELEGQQKEVELLQAQSGRQRLYIFLGIAGVIIIGMIAHLVYVRQKETKKKLRLTKELQTVRQQQFQKELDFKNRELTSNTLFLAEKSRVLLDIQEQLVHISKTSSTSSTPDYCSILKLINEHTDMDNEWETLKKHFDQVHPDFFKNLSSAHPKLSQNELKHCAYVLMNLSVKEVARILNINSSSVQMSRYRLKKKMGIAEEVTLTVHLHKIADSIGQV
ncbi:MAG: tetratricopeptide repeat protein [Roseivirga sp.]|nr:tetratricopeptide repeat protein [Roseivirga sp.]